MGYKPAQAPFGHTAESVTLSEILILQGFDSVSIPDTFTSNDGAVAQ